MPSELDSEKKLILPFYSYFHSLEKNMHNISQVMDLAKYKISNFKLELTNFCFYDREAILTKKFKVFSSSMLFKNS